MRAPKHTRWGRRLAIGSVAVYVTMVATSSAAMASGDFTATASPGSVPPGSSTTFTLTLTNISRTHPLNAAIVQAPQGFAITATSKPSGGGNASLRDGQVVLKGLALHKGQSASVGITATAAAGCTQSAWNVQAFKSSLHGRQLTLDSANSSLTVTCAGTTTSCPAGGACAPAILNTSDSSLAVTTGRAPDAGTLTLSLDPGTRLTCPPYQPKDDHWYGIVESTGERSKTITETLFDTSTYGLQVCFGAPYDFETPDDQKAPAGTLPDGNPGFVGLLEHCESYSEPPEACVESITPSGADAIITVRIDGGLPGDPFMGP